MATVTFATSCWEKDWKPILLQEGYLRTQQIGYHCYSFLEKLLIINNVKNLAEVKEAAQKRIDEGTLTRIVVAAEIVEEALSFFGLQRSDFANDWVYYNALGPLIAIYTAKNSFLLYTTGDVYLEKPVRWIEKAIRRMEQKPYYKVANLTWNDQYDEAQKESYKKEWRFYVAKRGFSDQMFLIKTADFRQPIYREIHPESHHFPRGDVFEKRVFSAMIYRGWERITYRFGSYIHRNFE